MERDGFITFQELDSSRQGFLQQFFSRDLQRTTINFLLRAIQDFEGEILSEIIAPIPLEIPPRLIPGIRQVISTIHAFVQKEESFWVEIILDEFF